MSRDDRDKRGGHHDHRRAERRVVCPVCEGRVPRINDPNRTRREREAMKQEDKA